MAGVGARPFPPADGSRSRRPCRSPSRGLCHYRKIFVFVAQSVRWFVRPCRQSVRSARRRLKHEKKQKRASARFRLKVETTAVWSRAASPRARSTFGRTSTQSPSSSRLCRFAASVATALAASPEVAHLRAAEPSASAVIVGRRPRSGALPRSGLPAGARRPRNTRRRRRWHRTRRQTRWSATAASARRRCVAGRRTRDDRYASDAAIGTRAAVVPEPRARRGRATGGAARRSRRHCHGRRSDGRGLLGVDGPGSRGRAVVVGGARDTTLFAFVDWARRT